MSTATIYSHRFDGPNDELTGIIGGEERNVPAYWKQSIDIAQAWEQTQRDCKTPETRQIALRAAMVMSPDRGGVFAVLSKLTRLRFGGPIGGGKQYVSWIHEQDFVNAIQFLINETEINGPVNLCSPQPLPQSEFMAALRQAWKVSFGLPATRSLAEIGAFLMRTDTELVLKSRRVIPTRLLQQGFKFQYRNWTDAAQELVRRSQL